MCMRSHPGSYSLSFLLPAAAGVPDSGSHQPSPIGCQLRVTLPMVEISGPSREAVLNHTATFLRALRRRSRQPFSITAVLATPARPSGFDSWSIIIGADVAFSPTSLDPYFPPALQRPAPELALVDGRQSA